MTTPKHVSLHELMIPDDAQIRRRVTDAERERMMSDLFERGLRQPLTVTPTGHYYDVIDGRLRLEGLRQLASQGYTRLPDGTPLTEIPVESMSEAMALMALMRDQTAIRGLSPAETCRWLQRIQPHADPNTVAGQLGLGSGPDTAEKPQHRLGWTGVVALATGMTHEYARRLVRCAEDLSPELVARVVGHPKDSGRTLRELWDAVIDEGMAPDDAFEQIAEAKRRPSRKKPAPDPEALAHRVAELDRDNAKQLGRTLKNNLSPEALKALKQGLGARKAQVGYTGPRRTGDAASSHEVRAVSNRLRHVFDNNPQLTVKKLANDAELTVSTVSEVLNSPSDKGKLVDTLTRLENVLQQYEG